MKGKSKIEKKKENLFNAAGWFIYLFMLLHYYWHPLLKQRKMTLYTVYEDV